MSSGTKSSAAATAESPPAASSRCGRWGTAPAAVVLVAVIAYAVLQGGDDRPGPDHDYVRDLEARAATDYAAAMQLGRLRTLAAINATTGPVGQADAAAATAHFRVAARLAPDACEPVLAQAALEFAAGRDDDAADLLHRARGASPCATQSDLYLGYVDEFAGSVAKARVQFAAARAFSGDVHENFYDRAYDHTDPVLAAGQYAARLRALIVFRDMYEQFRAARPPGGREFLAPAALWFGADVDVAAGTANLDAARRALADRDFVVLRSFLTPWEVVQVQAFYAGLVGDGVVSNFDADLARTVTYNDRIGHWMGQRLTRVLNVVAVQPVKHVYSFLCWHRAGPDGRRPVLKPHTDREDNDWTVSIQLHYDDGGRGGYWPLWVHKPRRTQERAGWQAMPPRSESARIVLADGDAVLFRGRRHVHWRDPMPDAGLEFSSLLLHYVPRDFDWYDFKFVRQKADPAI